MGAGALALVVAACGGEDEPTALEAACDGRTELLVTSNKLTQADDGGSSVVLTHASSDTFDALTEPDVVASDPSFSETGERIVFVRADRGYVGDGPGAESLWTVAIDGSGLEAITEATAGIHDRDPQWSPDGARIAFSRSQPSPDPGPDAKRPITARQQLFTVEPGGEAAPLVANAPGELDRAPAWSPDGRQVGFLRVEAAFTTKPVTSVWVAAADGTGARRLAEVPGATTVAWNPDGAALLVSGRPVAGDPGLRRVVAADGTVEPLTTAYYPVWSADGVTLYLFTVVTGTEADLRITTVTRDGDRLTDVRQAQHGRFSDVGVDLGLDVVSCLAPDED